MSKRFSLLCFVLLTGYQQAASAEPSSKWSQEVEQALAKAKDNRAELEKALAAVPQEQRQGMEFLIANMPDFDLRALKADFLLANTDLAYKARKEFPWGKKVPEDLFLNDVLPYANVDEKRDAWRQEFVEICTPIVKDCKTPSDAVRKLNTELYKKVNVKYSTQRRAANQSHKESMAQTTASCTGLSIILCDACRAVGIPARVAGTPMWTNNRGNHTWVEVWDDTWHFTGACEPDDLDRAWFVADAAKAKKDEPRYAIYATSFRKTDLSFPMVWARGNTSIPGVNVTDRYAKVDDAKAAEKVKLLVRVFNTDKKRVEMEVIVTAANDPKQQMTGNSRGEKADKNDICFFALPRGREYVIKVGGVEKTVKTADSGAEQMIDIEMPSK
jgi:transglutaminase-like putative cysteine protease